MNRSLKVQGPICVDPADQHLLDGEPWCRDSSGYTRRRARVGEAASMGLSRRSHIYLHRLIANALKGWSVDHVNRDILDNRRQNLRVCTHAENCRNKVRTGSVPYRGVKQSGSLWRARIGISNGYRELGSFDSAEEAAKAYDRAARELHGSFAVTNFPLMGVLR